MMLARKTKAALAGGQTAFLVTSTDISNNSPQWRLTQRSKEFILAVTSCLDPSFCNGSTAAESFDD
ncbi:hypothetical protein SAMN05216308_10992 [Nitrosospira sp. Nsp13]|nr:hypothetical protein SAMN05216308_10992 [Nitrosospira sp. Nsp13]